MHTIEMPDAEVSESIGRITKDLRDMCKTMSRREVRYMVDSYYQMQRDRIRSDRQAATCEESGEANRCVTWLGSQSAQLESRVRSMLTVYAKASPLGKWCMSNTGIAGVLTAGLISHINIEKAPTAGHIISHAGLRADYGSLWKKGEVRPWNERLKTLCWKISQSFVKVSGNPDAFYGKIYVARKIDEERWNEDGKNARAAEEKLSKFKIGKDTDAYAAYSTGKLPPAHVHARACRFTVKLFLSHYHAVAYEIHYSKPAPAPYVIAHMGHAHYIAPPNWPMTGGEE